jgi:predicted secreted protein
MKEHPAVSRFTEAEYLSRWRQQLGAMSAVESIVDDDPVPSPSVRKAVRGEAASFLRRELAAGPRFIRDLENQAAVAGLSGHTLRDTKAALGITSSYSKSARGWVWSLAST